MKKISILLIMLILSILSSCSVKSYSKEKYVNTFYKYHTLEERQSVGIDLRNLNDSYALGHIKGFVNYDYSKGNKNEFIVYVNMMYSKNTVIFLIDENGEYVKEASLILKDNGYKYIVIYELGYNSIEDYASDYLQIIEGTDDCNC